MTGTPHDRKRGRGTTAGPLSCCAISLLPIAILFILFGFVMLAISQVQARRWRRKCAGMVYLVCTPRCGWRDFVTNNLLPVVPEDVTVVWHRSQRDTPLPRELWMFRMHGLWDVPKPFLVAVTQRGVRWRSLNGTLQTLKRSPARSAEAQSLCREILTQAIREFTSDRP